MAITDKPTASWRKDKGSSSERGYTWAWTKARNAYLKEHPLCVMCMAMTPSRVTAANVVDHIIAHKGDADLMWDSEGNWQSLCRNHHDSDKQMFEKSGKKRATFDENGRVMW